MKHKGLLIASILLFVLFGISVFFLRDLLFGDVKATYEEAMYNHEAYKDQWISLDVYGCFGCYAEGTESYSFLSTSHEYYYIIWLDEGKVMPLSVSKKEEKEYLDNLTDATYDYIEGKTAKINLPPHTFTGTVKKQEAEAGLYYTRTLMDWEIDKPHGWEASEVLLDCTSTKGGTIALACGVALIPIFGIVASIISSTDRVKKKKIKPEEEYLPK